MRSPLEVTIKRISPHAIRKYICIFGICVYTLTIDTNLVKERQL